MLDQLPTLLAGLGPWGIAIGVGLTFFVQWIQARRNPKPASPDSPTVPVPSGTPVLDAILDALRRRMTRPAHTFEAFTQDIDPETAIKILAAFDAVRK